VRDIEDPETAAARRRGGKAAAEGPRRRVGRVLVAEDEHDVAELIRYHLTKDGYEVVLAKTGAEALKRAHDEKPDLILLDIMIPQMNGWEVCRCLKREPATADIPVIMLSVTELLRPGYVNATRMRNHELVEGDTMKTRGLAVIATVVFLLTAAYGMAQVKVDPALPAYKTAPGVSGNISSIGSDTLNNLMTLWAETFGRFYPNAKIQIEGKGSSTAPPALISGTAQLGPMSRSMKGTEIDQFEKKYGYKPTAIRTSVDALAVFVNKDNPIKCLTMTQIDAIFSKSRRSGYREDIKTWGQLGLKGEWANRPLSLYGRNSASGTYGFFKDHALKNGDYKDEVKEQPGSASVVQGVTVDRYAVGYSGIGYATAGVRAVPIAAKDGDKCYEAHAEEAYSGNYPLSRFLFVYVNKAPGKPLDPLTREFVRLILSREGQEGVVKDGYFPIPASIVKEELSKIL
jgi:phosphate transport system substrate-binding protein